MSQMHTYFDKNTFAKNETGSLFWIVANSDIFACLPKVMWQTYMYYHWDCSELAIFLLTLEAETTTLWFLWRLRWLVAGNWPGLQLGLLMKTRSGACIGSLVNHCEMPESIKMEKTFRKGNVFHLQTEGKDVLQQHNITHAIEANGKTGTGSNFPDRCISSPTRPTHPCHQGAGSQWAHQVAESRYWFLKGVLTSFATKVQWKQVSCLLRFLTLIVQLTIVFMIPVPYQI